MKVYIVELCDFDDYSRFGVYASLESARNKLKELFDKETNRCNRYNKLSSSYGIHKVSWRGKNKFVLRHKTKFDKSFSDYEIYKITPVKVEE